MARTTASLRAGQYLLEELRLQEVKAAAYDDPKALIAEINAFDPTSLEHFKFAMVPSDDDPLWSCAYDTHRGDDGWLFQAAIIDWWQGKWNPLIKMLEDWSPNFRFDAGQRIFMILKARQLGITWCAMALMLWYLLYRPGSRCVAYSYNEDEAKKLITRAWLMYKSLPSVLRSHVEVMTPKRLGEEPSEFIRVRHKESGLISSIQALPATKKAGHGDTVTFALMDETAREDYAKDIFTAILPATARGDARLALVSTANGVGNPETEEGNFFHVLYATHRVRGLGFAFLPWNAEPTRDEDWYQRYAMTLGEVPRNQQYPLNENDAFMLSGALYFERDALEHYRRNVRRPQLVGQFVRQGLLKFNWIPLRDGIIEVFEKPVPGRKYAMAVDTSTGRSTDFTSAGVIDLETGALVCELHAKIDAKRAALQLYALGKWYGTALIGIERQGGYGEALITFMRDGTEGLPPYPKLYRHHDDTKGNRPVSQEYGMPMSTKTRPLIVEGLAAWIRQRQFPWLSAGIVDELGTFVYADTNPSPRALPGTNDDRVMMLGILVELFRQYGKPPAIRRPRKMKRYEPHPSRSYET
jgi:hypothetical protein